MGSLPSTILALKDPNNSPTTMDQVAEPEIPGDKQYPNHQTTGMGMTQEPRTSLIETGHPRVLSPAPTQF